jgi:hypothetical protein
VLQFALHLVIPSNPHFRGEESSCAAKEDPFAPEVAMLRMTCLELQTAAPRNSLESKWGQGYEFSQ